MNYTVLKRRILHVFLLLALASCASQPPPKVNVFNQLDLRSVSVSRSTTLMTAAANGSATGIQTALESGDRLNAIGPEGSAFSLALSNGHFGLARFLLLAGADWKLGLENGNASALMLAAKDAQNSLLTDLIIRNADMNYADQKGHTAVSISARRGHLTTLKILVEAGADVNAKPLGKSVLMHVVEQENMLISQLLIAAGADVNYHDEAGDSALRIARRMGFVDIDLMLMQAGARP